MKAIYIQMALSVLILVAFITVTLQGKTDQRETVARFERENLRLQAYADSLAMADSVKTVRLDAYSLEVAKVERYRRHNRFDKVAQYEHEAFNRLIKMEKDEARGKRP